MTERFSVVDDRPQAPEEHLVLTDGSAVICSTSDEAAALAVSGSVRGLEVRLHSDLPETDQRQLRGTI